MNETYEEGVKISELEEALNTYDTDLIPIVQSGDTKYITKGDMLNSITTDINNLRTRGGRIYKGMTGNSNLSPNDWRYAFQTNTFTNVPIGVYWVVINVTFNVVSGAGKMVTIRPTINGNANNSERSSVPIEAGLTSTAQLVYYHQQYSAGNLEINVQSYSNSTLTCTAGNIYLVKTQ